MKPTRILSYTLTPRQRGAGIEVEILKDGTTRLFRKDETLRTWYPDDNPTCLEVQEAADRVLETDEGLFTFGMVSQQELLDNLREEYRKAGGS